MVLLVDDPLEHCADEGLASSANNWPKLWCQTGLHIGITWRALQRADAWVLPSEILMVLGYEWRKHNFKRSLGDSNEQSCEQNRRCPQDACGDHLPQPINDPRER